MRVSLLLIGLMVGCPPADDKNEGDDDDDAGDDDDDDNGGDDDDDDDDDGVSPVIESVNNLECTQQQSAGEVWQMDLTVSDPQGNATVKALGTISVLNSEGGEVHTDYLACNDGSCIGSIRADTSGVTCALEGDITFRFVIEDEDGNVSQPYDHAT